jgi:hypothetical protein
MHGTFIPEVITAGTGALSDAVLRGGPAGDR